MSRVESLLSGPPASRREASRDTPSSVNGSRLRGLAFGTLLGLVLLLATSPARADRVALLPSTGPDATAAAAATMEATRALIALGHSVVPIEEVTAAVASATDGKPDSPDEFRAIGRATKAGWVVVAHVDPAVVTARVEIEADLVSLGRVETVAREVEKAHSEAQIREMLLALLRPEGIGVGELPWEHVAPPPPPAPPMTAPPPPPIAMPPPPPPPAVVPEGPPIVAMRYPLGPHDVWPPYSAGNRGFATGALGFSTPAVRPGAAAGSGAALVGLLRVGFAPGDAGLELFGQLGGNLAGPPAVWIEGGGRWMLTPLVGRGADGRRTGVGFHVGPEVTLGAFVRLAGPDVTGPGGVTYSRSADAHFTLGGALGLALSLSPAVQLEGHLGNLRWVPTSEGSLLLLGATVGVGLRF